MSSKENQVRNLDILTVQEVAEALRVSRSTVWRWCRDGTFSSAFRIRRNWKIRRSEIDELTNPEKYVGF